jgi:prepilin-type N-terminal cleavage/methylation domain-containing protein
MSLKHRGYSLIELLVVVFLILIVMTLILCTLSKVWKVVEAWRK